MLRLLVVVVLMVQGTGTGTVSQNIYPQNPILSLGTALNFTIKGIGLNDQLVSGRWFSGNASILSVSMSSGRALAVGQGTTQVLFESSSVKQHTTVRVITEDILVNVNAPKETLTNVPFPTRGYNFSVILSKSGGSGNYEGVPFDCRVEPRYVGYVVPWMDKNFYCLFFPYSPELLTRLAPGLHDIMSPVTSVSVIASLTGANQVSGRASARFIGGFSILGMNGNEAMKLNLSRDSNTTSITLVGNTDVQIHMNGWDSMTVSPISRQDFAIASKVVYEVKVLKDMGREQIIIALPANGQRVEIDVDYDNMFDLPLVVHVFFVICMVAFCVVICSLDPNLYRGWDWMRRRQIFPTSDEK